MRLILIARHYPPDPAVGSQRARNVARAFAAAGYDVHVVTRAALPPVAFLTDPGVTIHPVASWRSPRELYLAAKASLQRSRGRETPPGLGDGSAVDEPRRTISGTIKRWLIAWLWLPDDQQGFIVPAGRQARGLLTPDSVLYCTAPPFSPLLAGRLAVRGRRVPWVVELRDPWTDNHQKPAAMRSRFTDAIDRWLESGCLRRADLIVPVSEGIARALRAHLAAADQAKLLVVYNGIERLHGRTLSTGRPFRILHAGTCSYARDPRPFFQALASVVRERSLGPADIRADFVGECRYHAGEAMEPLVLQLGLGGIVHFRDWVAREEALQLMIAADLHLLLAQEQPDQIPNKLYDYLGAGGQILAFADAGGETARLLAEAEGHFVVVNNDVSTATAAVGAALTERPATTPMARARLQALTTQQQMARLVAQVGALTAGGR